MTKVIKSNTIKSERKTTFKKITKIRRRGGKIMATIYSFNPELIQMSCDTGRSGSKYSWLDMNGEIKSDVITTVIKETELTNSFRGTADKIVINNEAWLVGGRESDLIHEEESSKLTKTHELSIYTCIARVLANHLSLDLSNQINVALSINVPLDDFKDPKVKQTYVDFYLGKEIELTFNDERVIKFKIAELDVFFESSGAIYRNYHLVDAENILSQTCVIDLGSKNDTQIVFSNQIMPVPGKNHMGNNGINRPLRMLARELERILGENTLPIPVVESIIVGETKIESLTDEVLNKAIKEATVEVVRQIKNTTDTFELRKTLTKILFTGGSSIVLKPYLKEVYENAGYTVYFSKDARYDNSKGALIKALNKKRA